MKYKSISVWIKRFDNGEFDSPDFRTQIDAGWYDWFCQDSSLRNKTYRLAPKIKKIATILGNKFMKTHYVFFKNNCPMYGKLYDDFRFCDKKTGNVIYTIIPKLGYDGCHHISEVWGKENDFKEALISTEKWSDVIAFFKNKS